MVCEISCIMGCEDTMSCLGVDSVDLYSRIKLRGLTGKVRGGRHWNLGVYNQKPMSSGLRKSRISVGMKSRRIDKKESKITVANSGGEMATNQGYSRDLEMTSLVDVSVTTGKFDIPYSKDNRRGIIFEAGCSSDEETVIEVLNLLKESRSEAMGCGFEMGDLVWGKIESHPWWPGQIYDEGLVSSSVRQKKVEGCLFVIFFGDNTYNWLHPKNLLPFECYFDSKSHESKSKVFQEAVQVAINEVNLSEKLAFACRCRIPSIGYEEVAFYPVDQVVKSRREFKPAEMVSFLHKAALGPMNLPRDGHCLRNVARILAYRKAVFADKDRTYDEAFESADGDSEWASNDCGKALAQGAASAILSERAVFSAQKGKKKGSSSGHAWPNKVHGESNLVKVEKSVKASGDHVSKNRCKCLSTNEEAKVVDKAAQISNPSKPSASAMPLEKALAKSVRYPPLESNKEKELSSPKDAEADLTEPGASLLIKFPTEAKLPSTAELKARFARFGALNVSATYTCWNSYKSQVSFKRASDAEAACNHFHRNENMFGSTKVSCYLQGLEIAPPTPKLSDSPMLFGKALTEVPIRWSSSTTEGARGRGEGWSTLLTSVFNPGEDHIEKSPETIPPSTPQPPVPFYPKVYSRQKLSQFDNAMNKSHQESCQTATTTITTTATSSTDIAQPMFMLLKAIDKHLEDLK